MSNPVDKKHSRIRRISKEEKLANPAQRRAWPDKKHLNSEQETPLPKPGEKNRIHSVLVALPVLMLIIGLVFYFRGESAQNNGTPVLEELVTKQAVFKSVSEVSGIGTPKYYLWYSNNEQSRGVRITFEQFLALDGLNAGDKLALELTPMVAGSPTLWAYKVIHNNKAIVDRSAK